MTDYRIRRAEEHIDWRALRMLLPDAVHHGCGCDVFVATDDDRSRRIIGALAMGPAMRATPLRGPKVAVHVIEPWRRRGVATALRDAAAGLAAARGAEALYSWSRTRPESEEAAAWRGLGFDHVVNCPLNRIDAARTIDVLQPVVDRLRQRGSIPAGAEIRPTSAASAEQVVQLVTNYLGGRAEQQTLRSRLLGQHPTPLDPTVSRVLILQGEVVGAMLGRLVNDQTGWVEVNVIHPAVRGGWANVWLKLETTRQAFQRGCTTFVYETYEQHADTEKLTRRLGGAVLPRVEFYRVLTPAHR